MPPAATRMSDCLTIASKKIRWITQDKWEISGGKFSPNGKFLTYSANVDGNADIYLYDVAAGKTRDLGLPKGVNHVAGDPSPFTLDGSRMLFSHTGPTAPGDLWVYTFSDKPSHPKHIAPSYVVACRRRAFRRYGRTLSRSLSQQRW